LTKACDARPEPSPMRELSETNSNARSTIVIASPLFPPVQTCAD
jgi:hypothetical protein